jgi:hypothetical protein
MGNKPDIPDGWAMPDDMAESLRKVINQKSSTTPLDDLIDAIKQMGSEIADIEPEPGDWAGWITYLLEVLQAEAQNDRKGAAYESMLLDLRESLNTRIDGGKW